MDFTPAQDAPRRILIADDDPDLCALLHRILFPAYDVTTVRDAESALVLVATEPPYDLIISDFMLPGLSGLDLLERIRHDKLATSAKIVMISGHAADVLSERARAAGAHAFLGKPFMPAHLRATVASLLSAQVRAGSYRSGSCGTASLSE